MVRLMAIDYDATLEGKWVKIEKDGRKEKDGREEVDHKCGNEGNEAGERDEQFLPRVSAGAAPSDQASSEASWFELVPSCQLNSLRLCQHSDTHVVPFQTRAASRATSMLAR